MQYAKISVIDKINERERLVETRFVPVETERRITGAIAKRILAREFPSVTSG